MSGFLVMGNGLMRAAVAAKYLLKRMGPYGQK